MSHSRAELGTSSSSAPSRTAPKSTPLITVLAKMTAPESTMPARPNLVGDRMSQLPSESFSAVWHPGADTMRANDGDDGRSAAATTRPTAFLLSERGMGADRDFKSRLHRRSSRRGKVSQANRYRGRARTTATRTGGPNRSTSNDASGPSPNDVAADPNSRAAGPSGTAGASPTPNSDASAPSDPTMPARRRPPALAAPERPTTA